MESQHFHRFSRDAAFKAKKNISSSTGAQQRRVSMGNTMKSDQMLLIRCLHSKALQVSVAKLIKTMQRFVCV